MSRNGCAWRAPKPDGNWPARIRTWTSGTKNRCATVTPRANQTRPACLLRSQRSRQSAPTGEPADQTRGPHSPGCVDLTRPEARRGRGALPRGRTLHQPRWEDPSCRNRQAARNTLGAGRHSVGIFSAASMDRPYPNRPFTHSSRPLPPPATSPPRCRRNSSPADRPVETSRR